MAAVFSWVPILTTGKKVLSAQWAHSNPRAFPLYRLGMRMVVRQTAGVAAELLRSAPALDLKDLSAVPASAHVLLGQVFIAVSPLGLRRFEICSSLNSSRDFVVKVISNPSILRLNPCFVCKKVKSELERPAFSCPSARRFGIP